MHRKKFLLYIFAIAILAVVGLIVYFATTDTRERESGVEAPPYEPPELMAEYTSDAYQFSISIPETFSVREMPAPDGQTIVIEDPSGAGEWGAVGIQIAVSTFDEDIRELTESMIARDIPDMRIVDAQPVEIGEQHTGIAFKSDNSAWDGASREVWFVFRGNLYQISTYERLDPLLRNIFATWKFF